MVPESEIAMGMNHDFLISWQPRPTKLGSLHPSVARMPGSAGRVFGTDIPRVTATLRIHGSSGTKPPRSSTEVF
jgi:hypothetical protein